MAKTMEIHGSVTATNQQKGVRERMDMEKYSKALQIFEDNKALFDSLGISAIKEAENELRKLLYVEFLQDEYGIEAVSINTIVTGPPNVYINIRNYGGVGIAIYSMGEKYNRTISWPENGQPEDEVLYCISFPTGPLMFSDSYPKSFFDEFWDEIKSYEYKYIDEHNHNIYFELEKAGKISKEFPSILKKYFDRYKIEAETRRIEELKAELERLEEKGANQ